MYNKKPQVAGKSAHEAIDEKTYCSGNDILVGIEVYSQKYKLFGKIDVFDITKGRIIERKREIKVIYDGYVYQVYAQYYALTEMGYNVKSIIIHDLIHNKNYPVSLPSEFLEMNFKFEKLIDDIKKFDILSSPFIPVIEKCLNCIYAELCDKSL